MASGVKWIKVTTDLFDDEKILMIESLENADSILVIWFKLLTFAGKQNNDGVFIMNEKIPYTEDMLSIIFRRDKSMIKTALDAFERFGMIEIIDNIITIPNWSKHQSLDAYERKKERDRQYQREYRDRQKEKINKSSYISSDVSAIEEDIEEEVEEELKHSVHCESCSAREKCGKSVEDHFEMMGEHYTVKRGKGSVSKTQKNKLYKISLDEMIRAIERYKAEVDETRRTGWNLAYKQGNTFFNSGYIDYLDKEFKKEESKNEVYVDSSGTVHGKGRQ